MNFLKLTLLSFLLLFSTASTANELLNWDLLETTFYADYKGIDPEVNNTHANPTYTGGIHGSYKWAYGQVEYIQATPKYEDELIMGTRTRFEVGLNAGEVNGLRVGIQGVPKFDLIGWNAHFYRDLVYGVQLEAFVGAMRSTKRRPAPHFHSKLVDMGVKLRKPLTNNLVLMVGYTNRVLNKHTTIDGGRIGIEFKF